MKYVKFDMHCHTAEGSVDAKVNIEDYIEILRSKGFGGMLVTDHDSYGGYEAYVNSGKKYDDFVVLRGIEYDSLEFGHFIVIIPSDTPDEVYELLRYKGLTLDKLIYIVHCSDGILGPAHPYGEPFMSFASTMYWNQPKQIAHMVHFDFVEGYNACESNKSNRYARRFASDCKVPLTAGSDAHGSDCVGLGYALLPETIRTVDDLIVYYKEENHPKVGGTRYGHTTKDRIGSFNKVLVYMFYLYNKVGAMFKYPKRAKAFRNALRALNRRYIIFRDRS